MFRRIQSWVDKVKEKTVFGSVESYLGVFGLEPNDGKCTRQQLFRRIATGSLAFYSVVPVVRTRLSECAISLSIILVDRPTILFGI